MKLQIPLIVIVLVIGLIVWRNRRLGPIRRELRNMPADEKLSRLIAAIKNDPDYESLRDRLETIADQRSTSLNEVIREHATETLTAAGH